MKENSYIRKSLSVLLIVSILVLFPFSVTRAEPYDIYKTSTKQTITSGVTLENIKWFTIEGWFNINVLRVDLSNPNVKVDTMTNSNSITQLSTVNSLAQSRGAIAAINAGFFNWLPEAGKAYPDGPVVESGKITSAYSDFNRYSDSMSSFSINNLNQVLYNYWKTDITLNAPNNTWAGVAQYNKPSRLDYTDFTILDRKYAAMSLGASSGYPDIVEMVVDNGKVVEIRQSQPAVAIPQNGYVVITRQAGGQFITGNFKVGDNVEMSITTNPDWSKLNMAVTGGAMLVKDGEIPAVFSHNISGRNPRTAIGSTADGKQLILATVDGRQQYSLGMTQVEMANLMQTLGAYNAINLDGGGSTTMVARTPGTRDLKVSNSPSDGSPRGISTAVGIFSIAPSSALEGLYIDTDDTNVFVNTSRRFTVKGYDKYFNPVEVDPTQVQWSVSGVQGSFSSNTLHAASVGSGKVKATVNGVSGELDISVLSAPAQLSLSDKSVKLSVNQSKSFSVKGKNRNGYSALIYPEDVKWSVSGGIGTMSGNTFTATAYGTGYIEASVGIARAYCGISTASQTSVIKDGFEAANGSFTASPTSLSGSYQISSEQKHSGKASGKLTYDFNHLEGTRAAYLVFSNDGIQIDAQSSKIGLWVYNTHVNSNWLGTEISDSKGAIHRVYFVKGMDWTGWKYVEASLDDIPLPAKLLKIYPVQISPVADSGTVYFDDLTAVTMGSAPAGGSIPQDTVPVDEANQPVTYQNASGSFRFSVFGESHDPKDPLEKLLSGKLVEKINGYLDMSAFVGNSSHETAKGVKKFTFATGAGYASRDLSNSRLIQLNTSNQSLRAGTPEQWNWFLQQLDSAKGDYVFIFMAAPPQSFNDRQEAALFQNVLTEFAQKTGKNVWVFYKGDKNGSSMERGVKYISTAGFDAAVLTAANTDTAQYVLVTVQGGKATFEFKPIV